MTDIPLFVFCFVDALVEGIARINRRCAEFGGMKAVR